jgi:hypothetical protein
VGNSPDVQTTKVDDKKRVRLPDAKPGQVFAYEIKLDGSVYLIPVKAERKQRFPRGSLVKLMTAERDREQLAILKGCVTGPE